MKSDYSWSGREAEDSARDIARRAARRSGMSLAEWLDEAMHAPQDDDLPSRRGRRRHRAAYDETDEVTEIGEAVSRLSRQMQSTERQAVRALSELRDRIDQVERYDDDGRGRRRRDARSLARLVEELTEEMDDADSAARVMIDGLRGRASNLSGRNRDRRLDAVLEAISELDDRMRDVEGHGRGRRSGRGDTGYDDFDDGLSGLRDRIDSLTRGRADDHDEAHRAAPRGRGQRATDPMEHRFEAIEERLAGIAAVLDRSDKTGAPAPRNDEPAVSAELARAVAEIEARRRALDSETAAPAARAPAPEPAPAPAVPAFAPGSAPAPVDNALEQQLEALALKIDGLRSGVEKPSSEVTALKSEIRTLKTAVDRSGAALQAVGTLSEKIEALSRRDDEQNELAAMRAEIADLRTVVERSGNAARAVEGLGAKIDRLASAPRENPAMEALRDDIAGLHAAMSRGGATESGIARLQTQIAALQQAVDVTPAMRALDKLEAGYDDIRKRLDGLQKQGVGGAALDEIRGELKGLRQAMDKLDARDVLVGLESRIAVLDDKVGRLENAGSLADPRISDEIGRRLEELKAAVASPVSMKSIEALERRIAALGEKLDKVAAAPQASEELFTSLHAQMQQINAKLTAKPAETDLTGITSELAALRDTVTKSAAPAANSGVLEAQMRELAARLEASQRPDADNETLSQLEEQVKRMTAQLEASDRRFASIGQIEENLGRIHSMLSTGREGVAEAAARAAQEAVRDLAGKLTATAPADGETIRELRAGLDSLQKATSASDQRTVETLDAVQKTLKTIVSRLSTLESGDAGPRAAKAASVPAAVAAAMAAAPLPAAAKAMPDMPTPALMPKVEAAPEVSLGAPPARPRPPGTKAPAGKGPGPRSEPKVEAEAAPEDHRPLEPGSGKPRPGMVPPPFAGSRPQGGEAAEAALDSTDPKASFIAAARRAAQAAAAEMAAEEVAGDKRRWSLFKRSGKSADKPKPADRKGKVEEELPGLDELAGETGGRFGRIGEAIAARKRPLVLAAAVLLLAIGTLQLFVPSGDDVRVVDNGPAVEQPVVAETATPADAPRDVTAPNAAPATEIARTDGPADAMPGMGMTADGTATDGMAAMTPPSAD
ncbi:MAG TPA: hypothetical protein PLJ34_00510, partial [Hyphomicrobiales bacterium]|nr:hypothetical protein [Hyphomicrobiales bacterium]